MLRVTVELHPGGIATLRRTLATMSLANISDLENLSDYDVTAMEGPNPLTGASARICSLQVRRHLRRQSVWVLIGAAIAAMENAECVDM